MINIDKEMNIVYGGSFNPPTKAHLEIVNTILNNFINSKVIMLPVGNNYNKDDLITFNNRYEMLNILFKDNNKVSISKIEDVKNFKGTYHSLNELSKEHENIYFLVGSDNINYFDKWINYEELLKRFSFLIIRRNNDDIDHLMKKYDANYKIIEFNNEINSTAIRQDIIKNKDMLTIEVFNYIKTNNLYGVNENV